MLCHQAAHFAGQSNVTLGLMSFTLIPQRVCASVCLGVCVRNLWGVCAHPWVCAHTLQEPHDSECWRFNLWSQKASFEGRNHHVSFKASNRSSHCNSWISHTHLMKWRFQPWRDMELESKAWINYPQLLQEHSFKGYISDHNLWGLCFLHLLSDYTNTHTEKEREYTESTHTYEVWKHLIFTSLHLISLMSSERGYLFD